MFTFMRRYRGRLKTCILDWSGTTADKYVIAPAVVFQKVFEAAGVPISMEEARLPMGLRKDLHIKAIMDMPEVQARWDLTHGKHPTQTDADRLFKQFIPDQVACLPKYSKLIDGVPATVQTLREEYNMKIGMTTGFNREMCDVLLEESRLQGFSPDTCVAGDEVEHGARPSPSMVFKNMDILGSINTDAVVKVDDTVGGIGEGLNAGCWTVGVSRYSNYMNVDSLEHEATLSVRELEKRNKEVKTKLYNAGAHYVINTIAQLPLIIGAINARLIRGETAKS